MKWGRHFAVIAVIFELRSGVLLQCLHWGVMLCYALLLLPGRVAALWCYALQQWGQEWARGALGATQYPKSKST